MAAWSPAKVKKLIALWEEGKTAGEIVNALNGSHSRNAVIGKAFRLKLSRRPSPLRPKTKPAIIPE